MRLVSQVRTTLNAEIGVREFFEAPTVAGVVAALERDASAARWCGRPRRRSSRCPSSRTRRSSRCWRSGLGRRRIRRSVGGRRRRLCALRARVMLAVAVGPKSEGCMLEQERAASAVARNERGVIAETYGELQSLTLLAKARAQRESGRRRRRKARSEFVLQAAEVALYNMADLLRALAATPLPATSRRARRSWRGCAAFIGCSSASATPRATSPLLGRERRKRSRLFASPLRPPSRSTFAR